MAMRRSYGIRRVILSATRRLFLVTALMVLSLASVDAQSGAAIGYPDSAADAPAVVPLAPQGVPWTPPDPAYKLYVEADGMYRLDYAYLSSAGLPVDSLNPETFQMFSMGTEIAIQVTGDGDAQFETNEAVIFYGRSLDSLFYDGLVPTNKYTGANVYWLTYGSAPGLRMADKDGSASGSTPGPFPHRLHLESNTKYVSGYPKQLDADHWYDFVLQASGTTGFKNKFYSFDASHLVTAAPDGLLKIAMLGNYAGAHNLRLFVNGNKVFEQVSLWSDFLPVTAQASVLSSYFLNGSNSIQVQIYNAGKIVDYVYPNWLEVTYYDDYIAEGNTLAFASNTVGAWRYQVQGFSSAEIEVYDVTDLTAVQRFVNTTVGGTGPYDISFGDATTATSRYMAVGTGGWLTPARIELVVVQTSIYTAPNLLGAGFGADYIIISHSAFWSEAQRLAQYRSHDFRVFLVDVQRIYDQFNGGLMSAESIRDFLAYANANWIQPAPAYVVLMGDGTSDPRDYLGGGAGAPIFIPPYLYLADPTLGETAADNRFVTFIGDDMMPDMHIGRLPVNDLSQAKAMVDKIIAYETQCTCDSWNYNTVFVADNLEGGGGNFYDYSNLIADGYADPPTNTIKLIPQPTYQIEKIYIEDPVDPRGTCSQDPGAFPPVTECTDRLVSTLNITGTLFVSYVGHATKDAWATERVWDLTSAASPPLTNGPCLPIMLPMTCFEGSFHEPGATFTALAEASTRLPIHGSIASWSPTGFGLVSGHDYLERGVLKALLHDNVERLGPAIDYAKGYLLAESPANADLVDTFVLIGDPALQPKTDYVCSQTPTSVMMASFAARRSEEGVQLSWQTVSEVDVIGFYVLHSEGEGAFTRLNEELLPAQRAGSENGSDYSYLDADAVASKMYWYKLEVMKIDGTIQEYGLAQAPATSGKVLRRPIRPNQ